MQFTVKELSQKVSISEGTIRSWIMKPIEGQPYSSENINYKNLIDKLTKYYPNFEKDFGFKAKDVEITKAERTTKNWVEVGDLEENEMYRIYNYSLKTETTYLGKFKELYIFKVMNTAKEDYKAYTKEQLDKDNIKIEHIVIE